MNLGDRYYNIIKIIITYYELNSVDTLELFRKKEYRYLLLLLVNKCNCYNEEKIKNILNVKTKKSIINNIKKAEEKLLISRDFREKYFEIEERLLK